MSKSWWSTTYQTSEGEVIPEEWLKTAYLSYTDAEVADRLGQITGQDVSLYAVGKKRQMLRLDKTLTGMPVVFKKSEKARYNDVPMVEADDVLVMSDVEAPFHDALWCSDVIGLAKKWGIKTVILAGDFLHFTSLSKFTKPMMSEDGDNEDAEVEVSDEIESAAAFSDVLLNNFERIVMVLGNHEDRLTKRLAVATRVSIIRQLLGYRFEDRFEIYPYYQCVVKASTGVWRVAHPRNYSIIPIRVASRLADKYQCNYIAGHGHDWGETTSVGGYYAAACGCCVDPERLAYTTLRDNASPKMQQGAWMLHDGRPVLLHPTHRPVSVFL